MRMFRICSILLLLGLSYLPTTAQLQFKRPHVPARPRSVYYPLVYHLPNTTEIHSILPKNTSDTDTNVDILKAIKGAVGGNGSSVVQFGTFKSVGGTLLWQAPLNNKTATKIRQVPGVAFVHVSMDQVLEFIPYSEWSRGLTPTPLPSVSDTRDSGLTERSLPSPTADNYENHLAFRDMTFISTYPATGPNPQYDLSQYCKDFVYDASAGQGVTVYIWDEDNTTLDSDEFRYLRAGSDNTWGNKERLEWLGSIYGFSNPATDPDVIQPEAALWATEPGPTDGHGTHVLSKVVGGRYGSAKNVKIVMVRNDPEAWAVTSMRLTLSAIRQHWSTHKQANDIAIVTLSRSWVTGHDFTDFTEEDIYGLDKLSVELNSAVAEGLLPICSGGNRFINTSLEVKAFPTLFAGKANWNVSGPSFPDGAVPKLIPVGSVKANGRLGFTSCSGPMIKTYARGATTFVAGEGQPPADVMRTGTSYAAPTVAGVAAYFARLYRDRWDVRGLSRQQRLEELYNIMTEPATERDGKIVARARWPRNYRLDDPEFPHAVWNGATREDYLHFCPSAPE